MANSINNNDDITYANGVRNPMEKNLNCNKYNLDDAGKITANELEIDSTIIIGSDLSIGGTCFAANFEVGPGVYNGDNTSVVSVGSLELDTTAQIGTNCNVGENLTFVLQGGGPTHNIAGAYGVNNAPALETYFQSAELAGQHGVAILRSSNGAISGNTNKVIVDGDNGIHIACDTGPIVLDTGGVGMIDLDNNERIINCVDPINAQDVATKNWVDTTTHAIAQFLYSPAVVITSPGDAYVCFITMGIITRGLDIKTMTPRRYVVWNANTSTQIVTVVQTDAAGNLVGGVGFFYDIATSLFVTQIVISPGQVYVFEPMMQTVVATSITYMMSELL